MFSRRSNAAFNHRRLSEETDNCELATEAEAKREYGWGVRHFQAFLCFNGIVVANLLRLNLSVAVVGMITSPDYKVDLSPGKKALVLSSFFWGYGFLQVYSGSLGRRGYAVTLFAFGNFASGLLSLALPLAARNFGFAGICITRFFMGLVQGNIYPSLHSILAKWAIPQEIASVMVIVQSGSSFGNLLAMVLSGYIDYYFDWPSIFYGSGLLGFFWGITHFLVGSESPEVCKRISNEEREYIRLSFQSQNKRVSSSVGNVPWKKIFTSVPVIATSITLCCESWGSWTIKTLSPSYISGVLGFNIQDDGLLAALPYLGSVIMAVVISFLSAFIEKRSCIPVKVLRRMWNSIGMFGAAAALLALAYAPLNITVAVTFLVTSVSIGTAVNVGQSLNYIDLSPNFAGVIMSIANTGANIAAIFGPLISTYLIKDNTDILQWRLVFVISSLILFFGNCIFIFLGSTEKQPWDELERTTENSETL